MIALMAMMTIGVMHVQAGNEAFNKEHNFSVYPSGIGKMRFHLLAFANGGAFEKDHWACNDNGKYSYVTYYTTDDEGQQSEKEVLFYYHADHSNNKGSGNGKVWVTLTQHAKDLECKFIIKNAASDLDVELEHTTTEQAFVITRNEDARSTIYLDMEWAIGDTLLRGKKLTLNLDLHHERTGGDVSHRTQVLATDMEILEADVPQLGTPIPFLSGTDPLSAGSILVPYISLAQPVSYVTSDGRKVETDAQFDAIEVRSLDTMRSNFFITMTTRDANGFLHAYRSNPVDIPAYHKIHRFKVEAAIDSTAPRSGKKMNRLRWEIEHPLHRDAVASDFFEIQRAYLYDFSDAVTIGNMALNRYDTGADSIPQVYTFDDEGDEVINNPYPGYSKIYYRFRRMSAANWGWEEHPYAASFALDGRRRQVGFDSHDGSDKQAAYFLLQDNSLDKIDIVGQFVWPDSTVMTTVGYDPKVNIEVFGTDDDEEWLLDIIPYDSLKWKTKGKTLYAEFCCKQNLPLTCHEYQVGLRMNTKHSYYDSPNRATQWLLPKIRRSAIQIESVEVEGNKQTPEYATISWSADGMPEEFLLYRKPADDPSAPATLLATLHPDVNWYNDTSGEPGKAYTYTVTAHTLCDHIDTLVSNSAVGSRYAYGRIEGQVIFSNGNGIAGATVTATDTISGKTKSINTDERGRFLLDSLVYDYTTGSNYTVAVSLSPTVTFHTKAGSTEATYTALLTSAAPAAREVMFYSESFFRYSGRVLYEGTSIPVRDAYFIINNHVAMHNGDTILTDGLGNFELSMPAGNATLQVAKDKHVFKNEGVYRYNGSDSIAVNATVDGIRFWDETKVKLTGRVVGGDIQGNLPLGLGLSKNNLGLHPELVFELEGDNISHFVYDDHDLSKTWLDTVFYHWKDPRQEEGAYTSARFEEKRIIVHPDEKTGEYYLELPPTKYRVVQATAEGYATLFSNGRTTETLDLTNSLDDFYSYSKTAPDANPMIYNAAYSVIYHAPAAVHVQQLQYNGSPIGYFGEKAFGKTSHTGKEQTLPVVTEQPNGTYSYVFGYPLFMSSYTYSMRVSAQEEYFFNGKKDTLPDVVPLGNYPLTIYNGLNDGNEILHYMLNSEGKADATLTVNNTTFNVSGEDALKRAEFSVQVNGKDVHATPVEGYIIGSRKTGYDVETAAQAICINDILRDPPGSGSYAFAEAGTTYTSSYTENGNIGFDFNVSVTKKTGATGFKGRYNGMFPAVDKANFAGKEIVLDEGNEWSIVDFNPRYVHNNKYSYTYALSERVQTSDDPLTDCGDATIYIGSTINAYLYKVLRFTIIDTTMLRQMAPAVESGLMKVMAQTDSLVLVITEDAEKDFSQPVQFAYTQKHIAQQIIPNLYAQAYGLLMTGTKEELQAIADAKQDYVYRKVFENSDTCTYELIRPNLLKSKILVNKIANLNTQINRWKSILVTNERIEVEGKKEMYKLASYSVSAGANVNYTENISAIHTTDNAFTSDLNTDLISGWTKGVLYEGIEPLTSDAGDDTKTVFDASLGNRKWQWDFTIDIKSDMTFTWGDEQTVTSSRGFVLAEGKNGWIDVDVYVCPDDTLPWYNKNDNVKNWRDDATFDIKDMNLDSDFPHNFNNGGKASNFIYVLHGGATRCPWQDGRTTKYYHSGEILDYPTLKIEAPHIELKQREISGVPADGVAVFDLTMWIESEVNENVYFKPHDWELTITDGTNPDGAIITMDGMPFQGDQGRQIWFDQGEIIHKTIEVRRGAKAMDYDSIEIVLRSDCDPANTYQNATFSVHYVPVSCPVNIVTPHDKWVMNTNSPSDESGYYLPVVIDGYDPNYENFDHIEFQYKLSSQSDDDWVNLCSYYMDSTLYLKANGNKAYVSPQAGKIENIHFYGERDPMEQEYDLRAVSYCRYGTDFIYRSSQVLSGTKDTRRPELFGVVNPSNGILHNGEYIEVPFSEPIAYNYLDEDNNFQVIGIKNKTDYLSRPTLYFNGTAAATTSVERSLTENGFSISLVVLADEDKEMTYITHSSGKNAFEFGQKNNRQLYARVNGTTITSDILPVAMNTFTSVTVTYEYINNIASVHFYAGNIDLGSGTAEIYNANGAFTFAYGSQPFRGRMANVSVWNKTLTQGDIADLQLEGLTGAEHGLSAYWPLDEGRGTIAQDQAHGADLTLRGTSWSKPQGLSLQFNGNQRVQLKDTYFNKGANSDFTFSMWFQAEPATTRALLFGSGLDAYDSDAEGKVFLGLDHGQLIARQAGRQLTANGHYADGEWHCLAIIVNRSENYTLLCVDGEVADRSNGSFFSSWAISGNQAFIGEGLTGYIDDLAMWELAMPETYLRAFYTHAPTGIEMGLTCYLPFYRRVLNDYSVYETHYSPYNAKKTLDSNGNIVNRNDTVILSPAEPMAVSNSAPISKDNEYEKMRFSWTSRDNDLVMNLNMPDKEINQRTVFFSLRDVEDLRGNRLLNPIAWTIYVDRDILRWEKNSLYLSKAEGQDTTFVVSFSNDFGRRMNFTIDGLPAWLQADETVGIVMPEEVHPVVFKVHKDLAVGTYNAIINLTDQNGLSDQLVVTLRVEGKEPEWNVPGDYNLTMNLIGQVKLPNINGTYIDTDSRDRVGAFVGRTCIGTAPISASNASQANLYIMLYGNGALAQQKPKVTLRLWQASTGKIYTLTAPGTAVNFNAYTTLGTTKQPIPLEVADVMVQIIEADKGWNWMSFYVQPDNIDVSFFSPDGFAAGEQIKTSFSSVGVANYNATTNHWDRTYDAHNQSPFDSLPHKNIYMFYSAEHKTLAIEGQRLSTTKDYTLPLVAQWNHLPYLLDYNERVDAALSDYYNKAQEGDIINGYHEFAMFDGERWMGSLQAMRTGEGYMLYRTSPEPTTLTYYPKYPTYRAPKTQSDHPSALPTRGSVRPSTNMPIVAQVVADSLTTPRRITAYADGEFAGEARPVTMTDGTTLWFLSAQAEPGSTLTFVLNEDEEQAVSSTSVRYEAFAPTGTIRHPLMLLFGNGQPMKVMENGILYIYREGKRYSSMGY